jgi:acetyltransferase-like isoleucine patch superfamily enzyme
MPLRAGRWIRGLNGLIRLGGLIGIHLSARVAVQGTFLFGRRVSIGSRSLIQVAAGARLSFGNGVVVGREVELSPRSTITVGDFTSIQDRCIILGEVSVGANVVFAPNVFISSGTHHFMERPAWLIRDQDALVADPAHSVTVPRQLPIAIHDDCWIGINAVVMRGTTIGRGSIIGANSVVTASVEPYSVVAGAPARLVGRRLAFQPPREISSSAPDDLPYFYSGFDLRQQAHSSSGWQAHGRFQLALECAGARSLLIEVETTAPAVLQYAQQSKALATGPQVVSFLLASPAADRLITVEARDARDRPCAVAIRRARLEG